MGTRLIIEGNTVYEIDEDCQRTSRQRVEELSTQERGRKGNRDDKGNAAPK